MEDVAVNTDTPKLEILQVIQSLSLIIIATASLISIIRYLEEKEIARKTIAKSATK